jgi:hypothetical protein
LLLLLLLPRQAATCVLATHRHHQDGDGSSFMLDVPNTAAAGVMLGPKDGEIDMYFCGRCFIQ